MINSPVTWDFRKKHARILARMQRLVIKTLSTIAKVKALPCHMKAHCMSGKYDKKQGHHCHQL